MSTTNPGEKKIGSLIAIEQTVASAEPLDSDLSVNLYQNIVYGNNLLVKKSRNIHIDSTKL